MQPSRPSLFAPRPGNRPPATRLLALLMLLALQAAAAAPAGSRTPEDSEWRQDAELPQGLLSQAARAALHFFNFRAGSPSALRVLAEVQEGSAWINQRKERKVDLVFTAELYNTEEGKKTNDDAIDFDYTVLLHEFSTQEIIPCRIHLVWYPGKPLKVKYHCQELQTPEASGTEEGSAVAPIELSNF